MSPPFASRAIGILSTDFLSTQSKLPFFVACWLLCSFVLSRNLLVESDMLAQPGLELIERELASFVEGEYESLRPLRAGREARAIDREKRIGAGKCCALVTVDKWVILGHTFPKGCSFFDQIGMLPP
jgi:hypothetical protein